MFGIDKHPLVIELRQHITSIIRKLDDIQADLKTVITILEKSK